MARTEPLLGVECWRAADLADASTWQYELRPDDIAELEAAYKGPDTDFLSSGITDFPLPRLHSRIQEISRRLELGRGIFLIRGFPVDRFSEDECERIFWGLGAHFGLAEPQDAEGALMHHIRDTGQDVGSTDNVRGFQTASALPFHNDGGDIFMLLCLETAARGGQSKLISAGTIFNQILAERPDLAQVLQEDFYFDARAQQLDGTNRVQRVPIFSFEDDRIQVLYKRGYIQLGQRFPEVPKLTELQTEALDLFDEVCRREENIYLFDLQPGDILIANNFSVLHGRTRYDDKSRDHQRHLLRLWLTTPEGRALPEVFSETREFGLTWRRRQAANR